MKSIRWFMSFIMLNAFAMTAASAESDYRLPAHITPTFQKINLSLDPDKLDYSGSTVIDITVTKETQKIGIYYLDLEIESAVLIDGDSRIPLTMSDADYNIHWGTAQQNIAANSYQLEMHFKGKINTSSDGMYLSKFEGLNYVFTQFEDMHARRAFPSFDEPSFKIPYQVTISAPQKHTIVSNTPVQNEQVENGWKTVTFKKTKPMPTYLIAYAVGELDSAEITGLSVPGKIYTPKGQAHRTKFAVKNTPSILKGLEAYFGMPYPYEKLDFVAVPNFTHGAMENVGLVTYRSSLLLLEDEPGLNEQRGPINTIAHELAHMWYGNLVTMAWWDDLWLNEAFASWMASKIVMDQYPQFNERAGIVQEAAFGADASPTVKPVKKVVKSQTDVMDGLGLNYTKGESVLQLIEALVGEDAFQKSVQKYMKTHSWKNAEAGDLWAVLSSSADFDVPAMMKTYLEQPGYPIVSFEPNGKVSQRRYHLAGAKVKEQVWHVPMSVKYKQNGEVKKTLIFLTEQQTLSSELAEAEWLFPNDDAVGYFRWNIPFAKLQALLADLSELNSREQKSLLYNSDALLQGGIISVEQHMEVLYALASVSDPIVVRSAILSLYDLEYLVDDSNRAAFSALVTRLFGSWFKVLGLEEQDGDSTDVMTLRNNVFGILAEYSNDPALRSTIETLAANYLKDPSSVKRSVARVALSANAAKGNPADFEKYKAAYLANTDANIRSTIGYSMAFPQPENVEKLLAMTLNEEVSPANIIGLLYVAADANEDQSVFYAWLNTHYVEVLNRMPAYHIARMPEYLSVKCNADNAKLAESFFASKVDKYEGMARSLEVASADAQQCISMKQKFQADFTGFLSR